MSIFSRIRDAIGDATEALSEAAAKARDRHPKADLVEADLGRLAIINEGMASGAIAYVLGESNDTSFIAAMQARVGEVTKVLKPGSGYYSSSEVDSKAINARRQYIAFDDPFDLFLAARYGQVLASAIESIDQLIGLETTPLALRTYLSEVRALEWQAMGRLESWVSDDPRVGAMRVETIATTIVEAEGGDENESADAMIDAFFAYSTEYSDSQMAALMRRMDRTEPLRKALHRVPAAMERLPARGRSDLVGVLAQIADDERARAAILEALADNSKSVREAAAKASETLADDVLREAGRDGLSASTVAGRDAYAALLGRLAMRGDEGARVALEAHLPDEKNARVRRTIESALATGAKADREEQAGDGTYVAIDGSRIEVPPVRMPPEEPIEPFTKQDRDRLRAAIKGNAGHGPGRRRAEGFDPSFADWFVDYIETPGWLVLDREETRPGGSGSVAQEMMTLSYRNQPREVAEELIRRLPLRRQLEIAIAARIALGRLPFGGQSWGVSFASVLDDWLRTPEGDLRVIEDITLDMEIDHVVGNDYRQTRTSIEPGFLLSGLAGFWARYHPVEIHDEALWPYLAERGGVIDRTLGLAGGGNDSIDKLQILNLLGRMPGVPQRFMQPLLDIATSAKGQAGSKAVALLDGASDIETHLVGILDDGRQDYRAGAARLIGRSKATPAARKALWKRLKKEKSEIARAAMLTALSRLDEDLSEVLSPEGLRQEAEAGLKKAKLDKLNWLALDALPQLHLADGSPLDPIVPRWWIALADKLKQPGGNALFALWLDLLKPEDRNRLGLFVLDAWIGQDTLRWSAEEIEEKAASFVTTNYSDKPGDGVYERRMQEMRSSYRNDYLASAAAHKGLLGLAVRADPARLAARAKPYLKNHGKRTNQAKAVLDMLAATGEPTALQVVIATHARFKQRGVQAYAGELIEAAAERKGWTPDELADRTVPTGGFDEDGRLALPIGEDGKPYEARLKDDLTIQVLSPEGKPVKSLPAGKDDTTKDSKRALTAAKKEIKEIAAAQSMRLHEAMCAEREWTPEDWTRAFRDHPVMRRLTERMVWIADGSDDAATVFRPTPEGTFTNVDDKDVTLDGAMRVRVAHAALVGAEATAAWKEHFADYEVEPLIDQFDRPLLGVPTREVDPKAQGPHGDDAVRGHEIVEREGWLADAYTIRGAAEKLGWQRGSVEDAGWYMEFVKRFPASKLVARLGFTGTSVGLGENHGAAVTTLSFHKLSGKYWGNAVPLAEVSPILLSECRNDYRDVAEVGAFDPEWEKKGSY